MSSPPAPVVAPAGASELADLLFASIERGDIETLRARVYAPTLVVWHNNDGVEQGLEENLRTLTWLTGHVSGLRYEQVNRRITADGFVQQHVLRGTTAAGDEIEVAACLIGVVDGGRIVRLDEYLDSASLRPLLRTPTQASLRRPTTDGLRPAARGG